MKKDFSYGVIPVRNYKGNFQVYLVKNRNGQYWGFPKGHPEDGETPLISAERELLEETGLEIIKWLSTDPLEEMYVFAHNGELIEKKVFYFIAEVTKVAVIQREEVMEGRWVSLDEVESLLTYDASKKVFLGAKKVLLSKTL